MYFLHNHGDDFTPQSHYYNYVYIGMAIPKISFFYLNNTNFTLRMSVYRPHIHQQVHAGARCCTVDNQLHALPLRQIAESTALFTAVHLHRGIILVYVRLISRMDRRFCAHHCRWTGQASIVPSISKSTCSKIHFSPITPYSTPRSVSISFRCPRLHQSSIKKVS